MKIKLTLFLVVLYTLDVYPQSNLKMHTTNETTNALKLKFYPKSSFLLTDSISKVSLIWGNNSSNKSFYKKYLNVCGLPIIGSNNISDEAFYKVREVILMMLQKLPDVKNKLLESEIRIAIIGKSENLTDLPEYKSLPKTINQRARGLGASSTIPLISCAEENVLCLDGDRYKGEDILIHEFAHTIQMIGISSLDPGFDKELKYIYSKAIEERLWSNTYAISSPYEYFAEGVQSWFNVNKYEAKNNGIHNGISTQIKLKTYDPRLYQLLKRYFIQDSTNPSCSCELNKRLLLWHNQN